ncbi:MAG: 7-carboxy-7-deazaguanine synthase QueE [Leptospira sp.]|nr:7-carboxy-7-deazaguanine synthase QueE [Leptospira sp.]
MPSELTSKIHEIYYSISGEGISQGIPTVFVRFAGCSLRCGMVAGKKLWCDTPYALSPNAGEDMTTGEVLEKIQSLISGETQVLFTGGEPLEAEKKNFCHQLAGKLFESREKKNFRFARVETNGAELLDGLRYMVFSMDYKLPGSGMEERMKPENFSILKNRNNALDEIKFVVRSRSDFLRALEVIREFELNSNLIFSPVYEDCSLDELSVWLKEANVPGARLSSQMHKLIWGDRRGV